MSRDSWAGVELRHLAALAAVEREGSFRGAADSLGYVQSAVSQQLSQLEQLVGGRLVDRESGSREVRVTPLGELLVGHAKEILARLRAARADLARHAEAREQDPLMVGVSPGVAGGLLAGILRAAERSGLRVAIVESGCHTDLLELVERGEVDAAFADMPLPPGPFASRLILRDRPVLLVAAGSEWTHRSEAPTVPLLAQAPMVVLDGSRWPSDLERWFAAHGLAANVTTHAATEATLRAFVAAGIGVAIGSRSAGEPMDGRIAAIDLGELIPPREIGVCWHSGRRHGRELELFCEIADRTGGGLLLSSGT